MPSVNTYVNDREKAFVKDRGRGYVRGLIQQAMSPTVIQVSDTTEKVLADRLGVSESELLEGITEASKEAHKTGKKTKVKVSQSKPMKDAKKAVERVISATKDDIDSCPKCGFTTNYLGCTNRDCNWKKK